MNDLVVVLTSLPDLESAETIARRLLEQKLAVCIQIDAPTRSLYEWQGKIESSEERPVRIKALQSRLKELMEELEASHPYEVPQILGLAVASANPSYLEWAQNPLNEA